MGITQKCSRMDLEKEGLVRNLPLSSTQSSGNLWLRRRRSTSPFWTSRRHMTVWIEASFGRKWGNWGLAASFSTPSSACTRAIMWRAIQAALPRIRSSLAEVSDKAVPLAPSSSPSILWAWAGTWSPPTWGSSSRGFVSLPCSSPTT